MLLSLSISDIVIIERLNLEFEPGLCALTGETGTGKSILLDALGLALGLRASSNLVRKKSKASRASVTAVFEITNDKSTYDLLEKAGITACLEKEELVLRRTLDTDGRSRAFINDQLVSIRMLKEVGERLVEIQGQFGNQGLLNTDTHRTTLDRFAEATNLAEEVYNAFSHWSHCEAMLRKAQTDHTAAKADEDFLRFAFEELVDLNPQPNEEAELSEKRSLLMNAEKLVNAASNSASQLMDEKSIDTRIGTAIRILDREIVLSNGRFDAIIESLSQAQDFIREAQSALESEIENIQPDPKTLQECEERLFMLRAVARKHGVTVDRLINLREEMENQLSTLDHADRHLEELKEKCNTARLDYLKTAEKQSDIRRSAALRLNYAVETELPALRLEKAQFLTRVERQNEADWGPHGIDKVYFEVITNIGATPGPLKGIASGGELSRFLLALKVALQGKEGVPTLVFDEVDSGVGGATAAAVGKRLSKLAENTQILVVTHSPQVASHATSHMQVKKSDEDGSTRTLVITLSEKDRREEIARMLAGATVTEEARAAAGKLIDDPER